jgi:hypothetical protein
VLAEPAAPLAAWPAPPLRALPPDSASGAMSSAGELVGSPLKLPAIRPAGGIAGPGRLDAAVMGGGRTGARGGSADAGPGRLLLASVRLLDCTGSGCKETRRRVEGCLTGPGEQRRGASATSQDIALHECSRCLVKPSNAGSPHLVEACRWEAAAWGATTQRGHWQRRTGLAEERAAAAAAAADAAVAEAQRGGAWHLEQAGRRRSCEGPLRRCRMV